jgi:serine/threonine protein kinase/Flp pilus assembly protein TadD
MSDPSVPEILVDEALVGQVADDFTERLHRGEKPDVEDYARRYPHIAGLLREVLPALQALAPPAGAPVGVPAVAPEPPAGCVGDFRLLREVGRGGMGVVYEAEQISLGRRVALKVLPFAAALDGKQLQRFKTEAQAAGHLHHPHIVPVFGVGCDRGVHYYAMQLIDGLSLADVVRDLRRLAGKTDELPATSASGLGPAGAAGEGTPGAVVPPHAPQSPASPAADTRPAAARFTECSAGTAAHFRTVARLGIEAAEALEHAHQLGVVHRDIKPANLLVDAGGSLWVTDFGLARLRGGDAGLTLTGDLLGTVRYMSPEQALGRRTALDPRTDVYSLGVTLYELLTLEPAYPGRGREEVLWQIARGEPRPPRRLCPALPAELETIVLKAMARNPDERYGTAQELADDLRRFLEDRPIRARRPTLAQRAAKWARRHRGLVRAAAVAVAVGVVVLVGALLVIWQEKEETRAALEAKQAAYRAEARARRAAVDESRRAEDNLRLAMRALDQIYLEVAARRFPRDPRNELQDRELLHRALAFYEQFVDKNRDNPKVRQETGRAYHRVGDICHLLGHQQKAEQAFRRAAARFQELVDAFPAEPAYRQGLASSLCRLGAVLQDARRFAEAVRVQRQALALRQRLAADFPAARGYRHDLADSCHWLGMALTGTGQTREAEHNLRQALSLLERQVGERPAAAGRRHDLPGAQTDLALLLQKVGRLAEAEELFQKARALLTKWAADSPDQAHRGRLATTLVQLGNLLDITGRPQQAETAYGLAQRTWDGLVKEFPNVPIYRLNLAIAHNNLAGTLSERELLAEAGRANDTARTILERLVADFPTVAMYLEVLADTQNNLAAVRWRTGQPREAEKLFRQSLALRQRMVRDFPGTLEHRHRLAAAHQHLGRLLKDMGQTAEAEQAFRRSAELCGRLVEEFPAVPAYCERLATSHTNLGLVLEAAGRRREAEQTSRKGLDLLSKLAAEFPTVPVYRELQASYHYQHGNVLKSAHRYPEAERAFRKGLALMDELAAAFPRMASFPISQADIRYSLGKLLTATGRTREAAEVLGRAVRLAPKKPDTHNSLAWLLATTRDPGLRDAGRAVELARRAVELAPTNGLFWSTLGVAHYRAGTWKEAKAALDKAMRLGRPGDGCDWFFLAMASWQLGDKDEAMRCYGEAIAWLKKNRPPDEEYRRLHTEAAGLLGVPAAHQNEG